MYICCVYVNFLVAKRQIQSGEAGGKKKSQAAFLSGKATPPPCACGAHCMARKRHAAGAARMRQERLDSLIHRKRELRCGFYNVVKMRVSSSFVETLS